MSEVIIRIAGDNDFESLYSIWLEGIHNSFEFDMSDLLKYKAQFKNNFEMRSSIYNYWIACDADGKIFGYQALIKCFLNPFRSPIFAESSTYISNDAQNRGIGKLLLGYAIQQAEKSSLHYIVGFVSSTNERAKKITSDLGFVTIGPIPKSKKAIGTIEKLLMIRPV